jgi:hypothetical protein
MESYQTFKAKVEPVLSKLGYTVRVSDGGTRMQTQDINITAMVLE